MACVRAMQEQLPNEQPKLQGRIHVFFETPPLRKTFEVELTDMKITKQCSPVAAPHATPPPYSSTQPQPSAHPTNAMYACPHAWPAAVI